MLQSRLPKTWIRIVRRRVGLKDNNKTYQYQPELETNPDFYNDVIFEGFALVDDNRNSFQVTAEYGQQRNQGIEIYLEKTSQLDDLETYLPELVPTLNPNGFHDNTQYSTNNLTLEFKVTAINKPNGVRIKQLQLHCQSAS